MLFSDMEKLGSKLLRNGDYVYFMCPGCKQHHQVTIGAGGWQFNGNGDAPTFSPSVLVTRWVWHPPVTDDNLAEWDKNPWEQTRVQFTCHSFVENGRIRFLDDCTHGMLGMTVDLPDV